MNATPVLQLQKLCVRFGGVDALRDVDVRLMPGEVLGVIGPNGAGKSTLFNAITGLCHRRSGSLLLNGTAIGKRARLSLKTALLALFCGFSLMLLLCNPDALWQRSINEPFRLQALAAGHSKGTALPAALAVQGFWQALCGEPFVHAGRGHFEVIAQTGDVLQEYPSAQQAQAGRNQWAQQQAAASRWQLAQVLTLWAVCSALCAWLMLRLQQQYAKSAVAMAQAGVARTFQNIRLFSSLSVLDNVQVAIDGRIGRAGRTPRRNKADAVPSVGHADHRAEAHAHLEAVGLQGQAHSAARALNYGDRRRLEIARALACAPQVLLLDEPAAGMHAQETQALQALIARVRAQGIAVMLIEHDMPLVMAVSDRVIVLDHGQKIAEGTPAQVRAHPDVIRAYLGEEPLAAAEERP